MIKMVAVLFGMCLANTAFAMIPAGTELPISVTELQKFTPGEDMPVSFRIDESDEKTPAGDAARQLAGCTLHGVAHLDAKTQRITIKNATVKCKSRSAAAKNLAKGSLNGQIVGTDHKTGVRVQCKYQPGCHLGTLKSGDKGFFLLAKPLGD